MSESRKPNVWNTWESYQLCSRVYASILVFIHVRVQVLFLRHNLTPNTCTGPALFITAVLRQYILKFISGHVIISEFHSPKV